MAATVTWHNVLLQSPATTSCFDAATAVGNSLNLDYFRFCGLRYADARTEALLGMSSAAGWDTDSTGILTQA